MDAREEHNYVYEKRDPVAVHQNSVLVYFTATAIHTK